MLRMPGECWSSAATSQGTARVWERCLEQILPLYLQRELGPVDPSSMNI